MQKILLTNIIRPSQIKIKIILIIIFFVSISNIYAVDEDFYNTEGYSVQESVVYDPFEKVNRKSWEFNNFLLKNFGKPIINTYFSLTTQEVRNSVFNFNNNLSMPSSFINYLLQFNIRNAAKSLHSFILNSTFGLFGLFNIAKNNISKTNFSTTLSKYGVPPGPYLMIPILGPNNLRGLFGYLVEFAISPLNYNYLNIEYIRISTPYKYGISVIRMGNDLNFAMGYYDLIENQFDSYSFVRSAYIQYQNNKEKNKISF